MHKQVPVWLILVVALLGGRNAAADEGRSEAADHFDRGVRLFNEGDNAGALREFRRAHELSGEARILLNVGLVCAEMNRSVEAVAALDKILEQPAGLTSAQIERARQTRDDLAAQIGTLTITTNTPAQIEIDNLAVGRTPLGGPLRVAAGLRRLAVVAPGHAPLHEEVPVKGGQDVAIKLDLLPIQGTLAQLKVHSTLPGADVLVDGKVVGRTPLTSSLALAPGRYEVSVRRAGYRGPKRDIELLDGATGELTLEPEEDPEQAALVGGTVALDVSEPDATVSVDGKTRPDYRNSLRLPAGPHHVLIMRTGFLPFERELSADHGIAKTVRIHLEPTEETRVAYTGHANRRRWAGWLTMIGGAAIAGGGGYFFHAGRDERSQADRDWVGFQARGDCQKPRPGETLSADCQASVDRINSNYTSADRKNVVGIAGMAVGGAALVTGLVLWLTADDPHRYDAPKATDSGRLAWLWFGWAAPGGGGATLAGRF